MNVKARAEALAELMSVQLRVRGDGLRDVTARAGRRLPKHLQAAAEVISDAAEKAENPRLQRLIDEKAVVRSERKLRKFLEKQDPRAVRRGELLDLLAKIAFVILTVVLAVFFLLASQGYFE